MTSRTKDSKTILIIDAGGRGAVLVDKYGQSKFVGKILVVPGNDLMQINTKKEVKTFPHLKTTSVGEILQITKEEKVDLADVAQDNAVEAGLVDELEKNGISVVGPTRKAGQLEWDKVWARKFMVKYQIHGPKFHTFNSEIKGMQFVKRNPNKRWFVKAAGLAEGKGAIGTNSAKEAINAIKQMKRFGDSGKTYLLEEWLEGEEFSAFALCDGKDFVYIGSARDHKRIFDKDQGENTGGMGCVSNPKVVDKKVKKQVLDIFKKTIEGLKKEKRIYKGVLYLGGMVVEGKVYVIEYNARWGDPEAEILLPAIKNDLYEIGRAVIAGKIQALKLKIDRKVRIVVAAAAKGYPVDYSKVKGKKVFGIDKISKLKGIKVYGAGIKRSDDNYLVNGGRILYIVAEGKNVIEARKSAYKAINLISIEGSDLHYRTDIGWRDI